MEFRYQAIDDNGRTVSGTLDATDRDELIARLESEGLFLTVCRAAEAAPSGEAAAQRPVTFRYRAVDVNARPRQGTEEARNRRELAWKLESQGLYLVAAIEEGAALVPAAAATRVERGPARTHKRVKLEDLLLMTRELATSLEAGVHVLDSLENAKSRSASLELKQVLTRIAKAVNSGAQLSHALARHPDIFPPIYVSMVSAGEIGGFLPTALDRLTGFLERQDEFRAKVRSMMIYPAILSTAAVGAVLFMVTYVVPIFGSVFADVGQDLPVLTKILLWTSHNLVTHGLWLLLLAEVLGLWFVRRSRDDEFRRRWDERILRLPLIGALKVRILNARMMATLATLLESGIPIVMALQATRRVVANRVFEGLIDRIIESVNRGEPLSRALERSPHFPQLVINMVATGEKTGQVAQMLGRAANHFEQEVDRALRDVFAATEPILVLFMAVSVALIAASVLLPTFRMSGLF